MAQPNDFVVDNDTGANVRTDLNNLFDAISINNGFGSAPTTKYKYMWYADTSTGKMSFYKANASDKLDFISLTDGNFFGPDGSASNPSYTFNSNSDTGFWKSATNQISIGTAGIERWKITANGALIASHNTETVPAQVNVTGGILPRGIVSKKGGASNADLSANFYNFYWTGSVLESWIDTTKVGTVDITSSDYRIKKNITTQTELGIDKIKQLRPVNYEYTDYGVFKGDGIARKGFIAHEVAEVIPSAVDGEKDADDQIQSLRMDAIVSVLTKALQEAVAKIETLEAKVAVLEGS
tara:strand:- start:147 stop:1034 length:888 start_codon:yes stop_codon:yes gene_type:complete